MKREMSDEEADLLIKKLVKWYRFNLIFLIVLALLLTFTDVVTDSYTLKPLIFLGVGVICGILSSRNLRCPFCHKNVLWRLHKTCGWFGAVGTFILPKKCPHCSRDLRVKKKKKAEAARVQK